MNRLPLVLLVLSAASCDNVTRSVSKAVPVLEKVDEDLAAEPVECDQPLPTPAARSGIIGTLTCGSVVTGNTAGGNHRWGDTFYQKSFCTPERHNYDDAPEAVYALELPANVQADVRLDSNCVDLDVVAVGWQDKHSVPNTAHHVRIRECEMDTSRGGGNVRMTTVNQPQRYLIGVDGKEGAIGNYRLTVKCSTYR